MKTYYEQFIYKSRYSRWLHEKLRRENWDETINRYLDHAQKHLAEKHDYELPVELRKELFDAIYNMEVMPSMRALMTSGAALERDSTCAYNCAYLPVDDQKSFDEAMYILLCGTGVGFSVERQYINKLPEVPDELFDSETVIVVKDSKAGWAKAYRQLLAILWAGEIPGWDMSNVRPAGSILKTFGGRASGPEPLEELFRFTINIFKNAKGRKLNSLECHDLMCKIADVVVSGGVRRSAMISLSNLSDDRMRHAKTGQWYDLEPQRALSNNSVAYTEKPDVGAFMREWLSLYDSKSGERGIFNRVASVNQVKKNGRRDPNHEFGCNPCCVSGDTFVLTKNGHIKINELVDKLSLIWNGDTFEKVIPYEAGISNLYRVNLSDGTHLDCTLNHRWFIKDKGFVETQNLEIGNKLEKFEMPVLFDYELEQDDTAYSQGFYSGDGNKDYNFSFIYSTKYNCISRLIGQISDDTETRKRWNHGKMLPKNFVPINGTFSYKINWLAGLLDSDGTVTRDKHGNGFQIASIDSEFLYKLRLMLTTLGVKAKICNAKPAGEYLLPDGKGGQKLYNCKKCKRLLINNTDAYKLIYLGLRTLRLDHNGNKPQKDARRFVTVVSVENLNRTEMTYCFTEPKTSRGTFNGIVTGNSEIILRPYQFCNLEEPVVRYDDDAESLKRKVRIASILGTIQSTYTNFPYLRKIWKKNTEEERLLGVSLTGIMDNELTSKISDELATLLEEMKQIVIDTNVEFAEKFGINPSTAVTTVKPSGTVSQLVNSASGIHARHSQYYIRSVRGNNTDPLTQFLKDQGIPNEPDLMKKDTTTVFYFPIKSPDGCVTRNDMTAIEQLELWKFYQDHWTEHKPSVTISVKEDEWPVVGGWVYEHFDEISGISFLPFSDSSYKQMPYQECTKEQYDEFVAKMPQEIDWDRLTEYEWDDMTEGMSTLACSADSCEIVDIGG